MKKYRYEFIILVVNIVYMILELIASRILSPYFGNSSIVWTSVIGIILLSSSIGNYIGGVIADKEKLQKAVKIILLASGITTLFIPLIQSDVLTFIQKQIESVKIGAVLSTIILFFIPSMLIGLLSPIITKIKLDDLKNTGKVTGKISAIATFGCILGDFLGGFYFIPKYGSNAILYVLAIILFVLIFFVEGMKPKSKQLILPITLSLISTILFYSYLSYSEECEKKVLAKEDNVVVTIDTEYGRATVYNDKNGKVRFLRVDDGIESATYTDEKLIYNLAILYPKSYDLMFESNKEIKNTLMIGGGGFSYPKNYISKYEDKSMDVIEIDGKITQIAKKYFYLDELIEEYDLENTKRLNIIEEDGRAYLNKNKKKYDAILNDAFVGKKPAETLTTLEAARKIYDSLSEEGMYLTNIIASLTGDNSRFLKAEVKTLKEVFKNVYVVPCNLGQEKGEKQNIMVIATDQEINYENAEKLDTNGSIILTDNYNPIEKLID